MSAAFGSSELLSTPPSGKRNGVRPLSGEKMKNKHAAKSPKSNGSKGLMKIFKKGKAKENGVVPVRPSCFDDDFVKRSESPDSPSRGPAAASGGGKSGKAKEDRSYGLWRSKVNGWVSDGRIRHAVDAPGTSLASGPYKPLLRSCGAWVCRPKLMERPLMKLSRYQQDAPMCQHLQRSVTLAWEGGSFCVLTGPPKAATCTVC